MSCQLLPQPTSGERCPQPPPTDRRPVDAGGFSLIEVVAVLAVVGILGAITLPALIKQIDYTAQSAESAALETLAEGLQNGVLRQRYIPSADPADWGVFVATNVGWQIGAVLTNGFNGNRRILLTDPNSTVNLYSGYSQTPSGTNLVDKVRIIILSSLSRPLPGIQASEFDSLWSIPDDTRPTTTSFASWDGSGPDLKIKRINLSPVFVHVVLQRVGTNIARFAVDGAVTNLNPSAPLDTYLIQNTALDFYTNLTQIEASQILQRDCSWICQNGIWRSSPGSYVVASGGAYENLEPVTQAFLNKASNPKSGMSPSTVMQDMTSFMDLYVPWAAGGFQAGSLENQVKAANTALTGDLSQLAARPN